MTEFRISVCTITYDGNIIKSYIFQIYNSYFRATLNILDKTRYYTTRNKIEKLRLLC